MTDPIKKKHPPAHATLTPKGNAPLTPKRHVTVEAGLVEPAVLATPTVPSTTSVPATTVSSTTVTSPSAPAATSQPVVIPGPPPTLTIPPVPAGYVAVTLADYRGFYPRSSQLAALPNALTEVSTTASFDATFGSVGPTGASFVQTLQIAIAWMNLRMALDEFFTYVKSEEAVAWKAGLTKIEQLDAIFQLLLAQNAQLAEQYPALMRLLEVRKLTAKRAAVTKKKKKAAKTTSATSTSAPAAAAPAAPATPATPAASTGTGGAAH